jgi:hypothetical protein
VTPAGGNSNGADGDQERTSLLDTTLTELEAGALYLLRNLRWVTGQSEIQAARDFVATLEAEVYGTTPLRTAMAEEYLTDAAVGHAGMALVLRAFDEACAALATALGQPSLESAAPLLDQIWLGRLGGILGSVTIDESHPEVQEARVRVRE